MTASLAITLERSCWDINSVVQNLGPADALTGDLRHIREDDFEHDGTVEQLTCGGTVLRSFADSDSAVVIVQVDAVVAVISRRGAKWVSVHTAAATATDADRAARGHPHPAGEPADPDHIVPIDFSYECDGSAKRARRRLVVPAWDDIARNYSDPVRAQVDPLMAMRPPTDGEGRLLLWHGPPGTGETTAIRALMVQAHVHRRPRHAVPHRQLPPRRHRERPPR